MTRMHPNPSLDSSERQMARAIGAMAEGLRMLSSDMPIVQISILMEIATLEGVTQREISDRLGLPSSTTSRSVAALSDVDRLGKPGLDLVAMIPDIEDRRVKRLQITPRGRNLLRRLMPGLVGVAAA